MAGLKTGFFKNSKAVYDLKKVEVEVKEPFLPVLVAFRQVVFVEKIVHACC